MNKYTITATMKFDVLADTEKEAQSVVWYATDNPADLEGCEYLGGDLSIDSVEEDVDKKPYTVTMTGTYFVVAKSPDDAENIVQEALFRLSTVDERIQDTETHWAQATTLDGHHSTIIRDNDEMSDYDVRVAMMRSLTETEEK